MKKGSNSARPGEYAQSEIARMKRYIAALCFVAAPAAAAPYLEADLPDQTTTHCALSLNGGAFGPDTPVVGVPRRCRHDLAAVPVGVNSVRVVAVKDEAVWGRQESAPSAPFVFTRPSAPGAPSGSRLVP